MEPGCSQTCTVCIRSCTHWHNPCRQSGGPAACLLLRQVAPADVLGAGICAACSAADAAEHCSQCCCLQAELDPEAHLRPGRHGEWTSVSGTGPKSGPAWGVDVTPPGMQVSDALMREIIRSQQGR